MSIRIKVIGSLLVLFSFFVTATVLNHRKLSHSHAQLVHVNGLYLPLSRLITQLQNATHNYADDMRRFYFHAQYSPQSSTFSRTVRDFYPYLVQKKIHLISELVERNAPGLKEDRLTAYVISLKALTEQLSATHERAAFESTYKTLRHTLELFLRQVDGECQVLTTAIQTEGKEGLISTIVVLILLVLFGLFIVVLSHRFLSPFPQLIASMKKIADGDYHQSLKVVSASHDEIAMVAREYNRMLEALRARDEKIQRQQKELLQTEKLAAVGQLSAEVVHEIRNPLNAISLNIGWLENELTQCTSEVSQSLQSMNTEIERLTEITETYLMRSKVPKDPAAPTDLHSVIREVLAFSREDYRQRNILIETELSEAAFYIQSDKDKLKQAFINILNNAKEAMPDGGSISVSTKHTDGNYFVRFKDTGCGMDPDLGERPFEPFFTTKENGTGLGLVLTKQIVEEASGKIFFESEPGIGTTFTFCFPA